MQGSGDVNVMITIVIGIHTDDSKGSIRGPEKREGVRGGCVWTYCWQAHLLTHLVQRGESGREAVRRSCEGVEGLFEEFERQAKGEGGGRGGASGMMMM